MKPLYDNLGDENRPGDIRIYNINPSATLTNITPLKAGIIAGIFGGAMATLILALTGQLPPLETFPAAEIITLATGAVAQVTLPMALGACLSAVIIMLLIRSCVRR